VRPFVANVVVRAAVHGQMSSSVRPFMANVVVRAAVHGQMSSSVRPFMAKCRLPEAFSG
jgi:hypothetical protein